MSNHFIPLSEAKEMTKKFRSERENILKPEFQDKSILPICETFSRDAFDSLLAERDCASLRIYLSMDPDLKVRLIIVGVNSVGEDILPSGSTLVTEEEDANIAEDGQRCPDFCPPPSPLNEP